jgi:hypothetical protein
MKTYFSGQPRPLLLHAGTGKKDRPWRGVKTYDQQAIMPMKTFGSGGPKSGDHDSSRRNVSF